MKKFARKASARALAMVLPERAAGACCLEYRQQYTQYTSQCRSDGVLLLKKRICTVTCDCRFSCGNWTVYDTEPGGC